MNDLKVYVWGNDQDYQVDYTAGLAVVIAHNVKEARDLLKARHFGGRLPQGAEKRPHVYKMGPQAHDCAGGS